jgi:hypothetical protein
LTFLCTKGLRGERREKASMTQSGAAVHKFGRKGRKLLGLAQMWPLRSNSLKILVFLLL